MAEVRQGPRTRGPAMKLLEELIRAEELTHGGNPIARWMFGNLEVKIDENENARPMKGKGTGENRRYCSPAECYRQRHPDWPNRRLNINVNRVARRDGKITIMLTLLFRMFDMPGHDDEWYFRTWKFINLPF